MSKDGFKVGETVRLNSGGPTMTIESWDEEISMFWCAWFDKAQLKRGSFQAETLTKQVDPPVGVVATVGTKGTRGRR